MFRKIMIGLLVLGLILATPMGVMAGRGRGNPQGNPPVTPPVGPPPGRPPVQPPVGPPIVRPPDQQPSDGMGLGDTLRLRVRIRESEPPEEGQPRMPNGLLERLRAWAAGGGITLAQRLARGVTPFMAFATLDLDEEEPTLMVTGGNRWALEAMAGETVTWDLEEAVVRVVYIVDDVPAVTTDWDGLMEIIADCDETTLQLFGTIRPDGTLGVRLIIARVPCAMTTD